MTISNKTYDILKWIALVALPAVATLVYGLGEVWGFPNTSQIVGTIVILDTFLGALLGVSTNQYNKHDKFGGVMNVKETDNKIVYGLELADDPETLKDRKEVTFKIQN